MCSTPATDSNFLRCRVCGVTGRMVAMKCEDFAMHLGATHPPYVQDDDGDFGLVVCPDSGKGGSAGEIKLTGNLISVTFTLEDGLSVVFGETGTDNEIKNAKLFTLQSFHPSSRSIPTSPATSQAAL